jgi:hypothetical protein
VADLLRNRGRFAPEWVADLARNTHLVAVDNKKAPKSATIRITYPNSCSLKYDELDLKLRDMLHASGIEPREPTQETKAPER